MFAAPLFTLPWSTPLTKSKVSDGTMRWLFLLAPRTLSAGNLPVNTLVPNVVGRSCGGEQESIH